MAKPKKRRLQDVRDYRARVYFERLKKFLGESEVKQRFSRLDRQLNSESGISLSEWVIPRQTWWIGLRQAFQMLEERQSFRRSLTLELEFPLQTAVKLSRFHSYMPDWKKKETRSRLLNDDYPDDVIFELDTAFHYYYLGYEIEWLEPQADVGKRTAEFLVSYGQCEFEVECKSKGADAGRKIERAAFYRMADSLLPEMQSLNLMGTIKLTIDGRLPVNREWQNKVVDVILAHSKEGSYTVEPLDGTQVDIDLTPSNDLSVPFERVVRQMDPESHPYAHHLIVGNRIGDQIANPLIFRLESKVKDQFLQNVLSSLRDADDQFTGNRSAVICCRIPEIDSFKGLQEDSAIANMTARYFADHSKDFVYAVTYVSEARRQVQGRAIISSMPALIFRSAMYQGNLPDDMPLSA